MPRRISNFADAVQPEQLIASCFSCVLLWMCICDGNDGGVSKKTKSWTRAIGPLGKAVHILSE